MAKVKLEKWEGDRRNWKARLTEKLREGGDGERGGLVPGLSRVLGVVLRTTCSTRNDDKLR